MDHTVMIAVIALLLTVGIQLATVTFKSGRNDARLEELERWRQDMRKDMHEISDQLSQISRQLFSVSTLIDERTERRQFSRGENRD
jgi:peptidoglycan hydrolase CwlO-like protein